MNVNVMNNGNKIYLEAIPGKTLIENERDAVDLVGLCGEHNTARILLHAENLTEPFFDLKTQVAGNILQKFMNYDIQAALVLPPGFIKHERFNEMAVEANRGRHFGVFHDRNEAEEWLMNL